MKTDTLRCENLSIRFQGTTIVDQISLHVNRGETVGLVGESGSGKTLTGKAIAGLLPQGFSVSADVFQLGDLDLRKRVSQRPKTEDRVSMIFQNPFTALDPNFTVGSFMLEVIHRNRDMTKKAAIKEAVSLLELVQIPRAAERMNSYPHELSGGQQQRVMIALALAMDADFIVADEATTALDVTVQAEVVCVLDDVRKTKNVGVVFISHDLALVRDISDRFYVMQEGKILEEGSRASGFEQLTHPYSKNLIASLPALDRVNIE